jgi:hypothetical protein
LLVANRVTNFFISFTSTIYILLDLIINVYKYGECYNISNELQIGENYGEEEIEYLKKTINPFIVYKVLFILPFTLFSSFIFVEQSYKMISIFILNVLNRNNQNKTRFSFFNISDEDEIIFSQSDFNYVLNLVNKDNNKLSKSKKKLVAKMEMIKNQYKHSEIVPRITRSKFRSLLKQYIYDWNDDFKFTSRFVNIISVSIVTLYYFLITIVYFYIVYAQIIIDLVQSLVIEIIKDKFPGVLNFLRSIFLIPMFVSFLICLLQLFFLVKETKTYLVELYKGKCDFVSFKKMSNQRIGMRSFTFGGYLVGFLIWGYVILYVVLVLIGFAIFFIVVFIDLNLIIDFFLKYIIQILAVFLIKFGLRKIIQHSFIISKSKVLAVKNFRAYNVMMYFIFFFNLFFGILNAFTRLIKGLLASALMMSRMNFLLYDLLKDFGNY